MRLAVRLTPAGGADRIEGVADGMLRVRVAARPVDGAANEALLRLLAAAIDVPRGRVFLYSGARSRVKVVEVEGVEPERLRSIWPGLDV